jgi:hypothetical protein
MRKSAKGFSESARINQKISAKKRTGIKNNGYTRNRDLLGNFIK